VDSDLRRWCVGAPCSAGTPDEGTIALTAEQLSAAGYQAGLVVAFHTAMSGPVPAAAHRVDIHLPGYRGKSFIPVLAWLAATRLAAPDANVVWHVDKQQGPDSVLRLLGSLGWELEQTRHGRSRQLSGRAPAVAELPEPNRFSANVGGIPLRLAADYGVFSPNEIDAGTELLLRVALQGSPVPSLADIGTGYAPLAIGLVRNGIAARAAATDVDCIALWLAERNAADNGITGFEAVCSADPGDIGPTPLTVCNVPTHINAGQTAALMAGLLARARAGRLLAVVHASLEARYTRYFTAAGIRPARHPGLHHVVLDSVPELKYREAQRREAQRREAG
jgi:16S rRNA G1207 methylase RsmC